MTTNTVNGLRDLQERTFEIDDSTVREIGYGRTIAEAKERAALWLSERGLSVADVGEEHLVIDIGRDSDGRSYARCLLEHDSPPLDPA